MSMCKECGLPITVCNALAQYRQAVDHYRRGRTAEGDRAAESAKEFYDLYREAPLRLK